MHKFIFRLVLATSMVAVGLTPSGTSLAATNTISEARSEGFSCTAHFRVFDPVQLTRLNFGIPLYSDCHSDIAGVSVTYADKPLPGGWIVENLPEGFHGPADILTCEAELAHFECQPTLDSEAPIRMYSAQGPGGSLDELPTVCPVFVECEQYPCGTPGPYYAAECGDADGSRDLSASDALIVLRTSVSLSACTFLVCDTDRDDSIDVTDALRVLKAATGLDVLLACPAPCINL